MTRKKLRGKDKKVGLKLSIEERTLILGDPIRIHHELADLIRATVTERHAEMMEWIGDKFDPERFNVRAVNRKVREL